MEAPLQVVAAAIVAGGKVMLCSKAAAPDVYYLPGGKPDPGEAPLETLARELEEELGVALREAELLGVVSDEAALERRPMVLQVYVSTVEGKAAPRAEIADLVWAATAGECPGILAPAIRNHVLPLLGARGLIDPARGHRYSFRR